jgi:hypothetical protein
MSKYVDDENGLAPIDNSGYQSVLIPLDVKNCVSTYQVSMQISLLNFC